LLIYQRFLPKPAVRPIAKTVGDHFPWSKVIVNVSP
jgi:hypothetical protein